jgi:hypothetical protein
MQSFTSLDIPGACPSGMRPFPGVNLTRNTRHTQGTFYRRPSRPTSS